MLKKPELDKRPVQINANGRPVAYLGRFPEFWIMRWLKKKMWGKHRFWR